MAHFFGGEGFFISHLFEVCIYMTFSEGIEKEHYRHECNSD